MTETSATATVREAGEFGLIARLLAALPGAARTGGGLTVAAGDDAAVQAISPGASVVVSTDALVEGVHFRLDWTDWASLGHKSLAVNLSDIAAMGACPLLATVSLGLRGDERVADLEAMYAAMGSLAERSGVRVAGGDLVRSPEGITVGVTVVGETRGGRWLSRGGARPGDAIVVSGTLGASAAGLALLRLPADDPRRRAATAPSLIDAHIRPHPRLTLGELLLDQGATAAMDLSDGLIGDLPKILTASGVSGMVRVDAIPVAAAVRALFPAEAEAMALSGGEDYELLATVPPDRLGRLVARAAGVGATLAVVGAIRAPAVGPALMLVGEDGVERPVERRAFDHFG